MKTQILKAIVILSSLIGSNLAWATEKAAENGTGAGGSLNGGALSATSVAAPGSLQQAQLQGQAQNPKRKFSASLLIDTSTTLAPGAAQAAGENYSQSGFYRLDLSAPLPEALTVSMRAGYSKEYTYVTANGSQGGFADTKLSLLKAWGEIRKGLSLSTGLSLALPTSQDSRKVGLQSAVGFSVPIEYKIAHWSFSLEPRYSEYYHDAYVALDGTPNNSRAVSLVTTAAYMITEKFGTDLTFWPSRSWTYRGTPSTRYVASYELTYDISKNFGTALGLMTSENALKSNGLDANYTVFDANMTTGFFDVMMSL